MRTLTLPVTPVRARRLLGAGLVVTTLLGGLACSGDEAPGSASGTASGPVPTATSVVAAAVDGSGPVTDPAAFANAAAMRVNMLPQTAATPHHTNVSIKTVDVRAIRNTDHVGFLLEWDDSTHNPDLRTDQFGDQVAIELPFDTKNPPSPMMGSEGAPVYILQWRASLQFELDNGKPDLKSQYPNAVIDFYPADKVGDEQKTPYEGARGRNNPVSAPPGTPVLSHVAEGFGTLTATPDHPARANGKWENGKWKVVVSYPLGAQPPHVPLKAGDASQIAFAVWDGGNREVGGRKGWTAWIPFAL